MSTYVKCRVGSILKFKSGGTYIVITNTDPARQSLSGLDPLYLLVPTGNFNSPLEHTGGCYGRGWDVVEVLNDYIPE